MSTDLEHDLRELFARDAARAPVPRHLAEGARVRAGQQARRQRRVAVVGSAAVAAALIGGFALIRPTAEHSAPTSSRPPAPTATTVSSEGPVVAEKPALYFHNVEVPVPAAMLTAPVNCGAPKSDAAYVVGYDGGGCPANAKGAPRVTTVVLQPWRAAGIPAPPVGRQVLADGRTQMVTRI